MLDLISTFYLRVLTSSPISISILLEMVSESSVAAGMVSLRVPTSLALAVEVGVTITPKLFEGESHRNARSAIGEEIGEDIVLDV